MIEIEFTSEELELVKLILESFMDENIDNATTLADIEAEFKNGDLYTVRKLAAVDSVLKKIEKKEKGW